MKVKKTNKYINNKEFYEEYLKWKELNYEGNVPEKIIMAFYKLANSIAKSKNFINYSNLWLEEMISEGFMLCIEKAKMFNPYKSKNPFSYFTSVIRNSFIMYIKKAKKQKLYNRNIIFNMIEEKSIRTN